MTAGILERLALDRSELRAWAMYDWANSAMITSIVTALFPIYYASVAAAGIPPAQATFRFGVTTTTGMVIVALLAPILGALSDVTGSKKRFLAAFLALGATSVGLLFFIQRGDWIAASVLFVLATIGANASFVFYDALLPHVARPGEMDRLSTSGYALGYVGGGLLLAVQLAWILKPGAFGLPHGDDLTGSQATLPTRLAFLSVAVWWVLFSLPLLRHVREPKHPRASIAGSGTGFGDALGRLRATARDLRRYPEAGLMLLAFLIYNDGIGTIVRMAAIYGTEIGIGRSSLIGSILLVQCIGIPFAFLFGGLASRFGAKRMILVGLVIYLIVSIYGYFLRTGRDFLVLACLVGIAQGGTQALSRSLFASMIPARRSGEFFGIFAVMEKFAGIFGPALFSLAIALTGSSRAAILSVLLFFVAGGVLLTRVDVEAGRRRATSEAAAG